MCRSSNNKTLSRNTRWGWVDDSEIKSTNLSSKEPRFNSQHPCGYSQPSVTAVLRIPAPSLASVGITSMVHRHMQEKHSSCWSGAMPRTLGPNFVGLQMKWELGPRQPPLQGVKVQALARPRGWEVAVFRGCKSLSFQVGPESLGGLPPLLPRKPHRGSLTV